MKVKEVMTRDVRCCSPAVSLAAAGALMLDGDCGMLPVVEGGKLIGILTDRDMCIALATRNQRASDVTVREVARPQVHTCGPDDDVQAVLETMKRHQIRRLPVEDVSHTVVGVVAMNDVALAAGPRKPVRDADVMSTLRSICGHHHPAPRTATA